MTNLDANFNPLPRTFWTPERKTLLRDLWDKGLSTSKIAEALGGGCTKNAVIGKANRLRLPKHADWRRFPAPLTPVGADVAAEAPTPADIAPEPPAAVAAAPASIPEPEARSSSPVAHPGSDAVPVAGSGRENEPAPATPPTPPKVAIIAANAAPPPPPPRKRPEIALGPVTILDLRECHCRFIGGAVDGVKTLYCGALRAPGSSYCGEHDSHVRGRGTPSERAALQGFFISKRTAITGSYK